MQRSYSYYSASKVVQVVMSCYGLRRLQQWVSELEVTPIIYLLDVEFVSLRNYLGWFPGLYEEAEKLLIHVHNVPGSSQSPVSRLSQLRQSRLRPSLRYLGEEVGATLITNGEYISNQLLKYGIREEQIVTSRWGSSLSKTRASESNVGNSYLMLGIWREEKNIPMVLESFSGIKKPCNLTIAGYPRDISGEELKQIIAGLDLDQHEISIIDQYLDEHQYRSLLDEHRFLLLPYEIGTQGSSGPLIDGLMRNCIPIISKGGERARIVESHDIGYLLPEISVPALRSVIQKTITDSASGEIGQLLDRIHSIRLRYRWSQIIGDLLQRGLFD